MYKAPGCCNVRVKNPFEWFEYRRFHTKINSMSLANLTKKPGLFDVTGVTGQRAMHESDVSIDIVFIHSFGEDMEGTWTDPGSKAFWPKWLSSERGLENARILLFGYTVRKSEIQSASEQVSLLRP